MDVPCALALALLATLASATPQSHDNILRVQLWDEEGLSREPITTEAPTTRVYKRKSTVDLNLLYNAMLGEDFAGFGRFTRHKVRHKRRRSRRSGDELPWRFHMGSSRNVAEFDDNTSWSVIEKSAVSVSEEVPSPLRLQQDNVEEEEKAKKQLPVVPKCCAGGQNLTVVVVDGQVKSVCTRSNLIFQPSFYQANESHMWSYDSNVFETIVGNPCRNSYRYKLEPDKNPEDEFYLLINGSLFVPSSNPYFLGTKDFCMETFWNESFPAGVTLPLVCFPEATDEVKTSGTLIAYAVGLIISVPFLLATTCVYLFIRELRDTHGKALACHSICLSIAFSCLAATQLAGHAFPNAVCNTMAYLIQFSFVSCFFWLNVMCFDIYLNVKRYISSTVSRRSMRRRFAWYCVYAILLPVILLVVTIIMDLSPAVPSTYLKPNFGVKGCWFQTDQAALPYFYGPLAAILLSNLIIFLLTSRAFAQHYDKLKDVTPLDMTHSDCSVDDWSRLGQALGSPITTLERPSPAAPAQSNFNHRVKKYRKIFRTCCMLSVIMGLSWVLEVVSWAVGAGGEVMSVWSVFDLINALQGVVIFAIFVLQQPVRSYVKFSKIFSICRKSRNGSEVAVVSEVISIDYPKGRRDYV